MTGTPAEPYRTAVIVLSDRAASGERVGGGSGRRRHQHPVAAERRHRAPIDFDDHPQHAQSRTFFQAGFVECPALIDDLAAFAHHDVERQALFHPIVLRDDMFQH